MNINEQIFRMELTQLHKALKLQTILWVDDQLQLYHDHPPFVEFCNLYDVHVMKQNFQEYLQSEEQVIVVIKKQLAEQVPKSVNKVQFQFLPLHYEDQTKFLIEKRVQTTIDQCKQKLNQLRYCHKGINFMPILQSFKGRIHKQFMNQKYLSLPSDRTKSKQEFVQFCKFMLPQDQSLQSLERYYPQSINYEYSINFFTREDIFIKLINKVFSSTNDPQILAYIRMPYHDLYYGVKILNEGKQVKNVYVGCQLQTKELDLLKENQLIVVSDVMRGYTKPQLAQNMAVNAIFQIEIKNQNQYLITQKIIDYCLEEEVIFNSLSVFKVVSVDRDDLIKVRLRYGVKEQLSSFFQCIQKNRNKIWKQGDVSYQNQDLNNAVHYYHKIQQNTPQDQKLNRLIIANRNGQLLKEANPQKAFQHHCQQILLKKEIFGNNLPNQQTHLNNISHALFCVHKYTQSMKLLEKCPNNLITTNNKAMVLKGMKKYSKALQLLNQIKTQNNLEKATIINNIGCILKELPSKKDQAFIKFDQSKKIVKQFLGKNSNQQALIQGNIGMSKLQQSSFLKALDNINNCLRIWQMNAGVDSYEYLRGRIRKGELMMRVNKDEETRKIFNECKTSISQVMGERNELYGDLLTKFGQFQSITQNQQTSQILLNEAKEVYEGIINYTIEDKIKHIEQVLQR